MDEGDDRVAIVGSAAVVVSQDAESEDDEWEYEPGFWTYVIPTAPLGSKQFPADSADTSTAQKRVSPGTSFPTTASAPPASEIKASAESGNDLAEAESSATATDVQTDRDSSQSSVGDQSAASPSPGQIGIANFDAATAASIEEKAAANRIRKMQ